MNQIPKAGHVICPECENEYPRYRFPTIDKSGPCSVCRAYTRMEIQQQKHAEIRRKRDEREKKIKKMEDETNQHPNLKPFNEEISKIGQQMRDIDIAIEKLKQQKRGLNQQKDNWIHRRNGMFRKTLKKHPDYDSVYPI